MLILRDQRVTELVLILRDQRVTLICLTAVILRELLVRTRVILRELRVNLIAAPCPDSFLVATTGYRLGGPLTEAFSRKA